MSKPKAQPSSKFGMLKNLNQQQENIKPEKHNSAIEEIPSVELKHFSTYMPHDLYSRLQIHVAKQKAQRPQGGEKPSIQNAITQAVRDYLAQHEN